MRHVGAVDGSSNNNVGDTGVVWWQQETRKADGPRNQCWIPGRAKNIRLPETATPALEPGYLPTSRGCVSGKRLTTYLHSPIHNYGMINSTLSTQLLINKFKLVGSNCNSSNAKRWEISHYATETFLTTAVTRELTVRETYGLSMQNSTLSLSNRNMTTRYHTSDTNTCHSDKDSFTHQTAEVNISTRTVPRTVPDNTIRACSWAIQGRCTN